MSHPMWVRGLKYFVYLLVPVPAGVAPHVGAWIEIAMPYYNANQAIVAPHVGAWIEIRMSLKHRRTRECRTPCGCVD